MKSLESEHRDDMQEALATRGGMVLVVTITWLVLHSEDICPVDAAEARPKEHAHSTVTSKTNNRKVSVTAVP